MMNKVCGIYVIKNKTNGKKYIGKSINNKHYNSHLQRSYNKYGKENFIFEIVEECSKDILHIREQYWIDLNKGKIYNNELHVIDQKGTNNSFFGKKHTEESKKKMSEWNKKHYPGKNNPNFGNRYNFKTRLKMSIENPNVKLTVDNVKEIKKLLKEKNLKHREIAEKFNVRRTVITRINSGARWNNVKLEEK